MFVFSSLTSTTTENFIAELKKVSDLPTIQGRLFDFVRSSPKREEELLQLLHDEPAGLSDLHLDAINYALMEAIQADQCLCSCNTIKEFGLGLRGNTRTFYNELISADFFSELILTGKHKELALPQYLSRQISDFDSPTYDETNVLLEELSLRIHLENGKPYNQFSIQKRGLETFLKIDGPAEQLVIESYTQHEIAKFQSVLSSSRTEERYKSRYMDIGVKQIAIITNGNMRSVQTLQKLIKNLEKFGHSNVVITIFDDKEGSQLGEKIRELSSTESIQIRYMGWVQRDQTIESLTRQLGADKKANIEAAIGHGTGIGGNRNFVALCLGKQNYLSIDDDIEGAVKTLIDENYKSVDVDILTISSRHIRPPEILAADFRYCGHLDNAVMSSIGVFFANSQLKSPVDSWNRAYNSRGAAVWDSIRENSSKLIYDRRFSNVLSGGAVCFPSAYNGLVSRQPTIIATEHTGRNQDVFLSVIPESILSLAGISPAIFASAASAVQHNREVNLRNSDLIKNALEENSGQFLSCIVGFLIQDSAQVKQAIFSGRKPFENISALFEVLGKEIEALTSLPDIEMLNALAKIRPFVQLFIDDIKDLFLMHCYKGILAHPDPLVAEIKLAEMKALAKDPERKSSYMKLLADLEKNFAKFFGSNLEDIPEMNSEQFDDLIFRKLVMNTRAALQKYGLGLTIWQDMIIAADS